MTKCSASFFEVTLDEVLFNSANNDLIHAKLVGLTESHKSFHSICPKKLRSMSASACNYNVILHQYKWLFQFFCHFPLFRAFKAFKTAGNAVSVGLVD